MTGFDPDFEDLPCELPVFPLAGALLLPKGHMSLRIFESRYIRLVNDILASKYRIFAIVQPKDNAGENPAMLSDLYPVACVGRLIEFRETLDCHYHIELKGLYRCDLLEEVMGSTPYRNFRVDFSPYHSDGDLLHIHEASRKMLFTVVKSYFQQREIQVNLELLENLHDEVLITALSMVCPFSAAEKQGLLEAPDLAQRAEFLMNALAMHLGGSHQMALQ